ncbi:non-ribosomal peptide synthetase [Gordonia hydrophobica]|uniref:Non-ribosomal peptide synthetase n=2 Tax=Gordonia hydrophobica TaxID=40516 RepID=A0ABZ2TWJ9_9ACTN|nr:non-ribosomal peptide synthetase [Gordonia hydrophobica]MBM7365733.1 amino acid adenylation domain-containing protein [Gordonia hydrophobica]
MSDRQAKSTLLTQNWGRTPATLDLLEVAATLAPDVTALEGASGPVTYAALYTRLSATAGVLADQGLDTDGAVTAGVSAIVKTPEMTPVDALLASAKAVTALRSAALEFVGTTDLNSLPGLFTSAVHRFGNRTAVTDPNGRELTYIELDDQSTAVARALVDRGVGVDTSIALAVSRTVNLPVAILGILKAGGAYIPLDLAHPTERLGYIVENARPTGLLVDDSVGDRLDELDLPRWDLEALIAAGRESSAELPASIPASASAYVIYTSGSTGRPKGVQVEHRNVVALMAAAQIHYGFTENDVWSMFHSHAFDVSVFELWGPLLFGGRLLVVDRAVAREPGQLVELLAEQGVTVFSQTPSAFYQYVEARERVHVDSTIRYAVLAGEAVSFEQMRRWYRSFPDEQTVVVNMYGITETTVHSTFRALSAELVESTDASDVGDGLPALTVHVLDERLRHTPDGVPGEIYVSGTQVTRGYQNRSDLTATRFIADPFAADGTRMYRSGDMAIRRGDTVEYLGRSDGQVQLRGFRVEMGEVEGGMLRVDEISGAAAKVTKAANGDDLLVGYVVPADGVVVDSAELRRAIGAHVPGYMVPDVIVELDQLPLTVNGKLDRRALPEPTLGSDEFVSPETDTEQRIAAQFAEVLGIDEISATASFFDLGGNSLAAARIVGRVGEALDVDLSVRDLFDAPSVRELANAVGDKAPALPPIAAVESRPDRIPLSFAQQRMWFINRFDAASGTYNIPAVLKLTGTLDPAVLRQAVVDVVERYEVLRTTFPDEEGRPYQSIAPSDSVSERLDWALVTSADDVHAAVTDGFDLSTEWPIRARLLTVSADEHVFALVVHHIGADGESFGPLIGDLLVAYSARAAGGAPAFEPLAVQFADFAVWQHNVLGDIDDATSVVGGQLDYWRKQLDDVPDVLELPTDRPRPATASYRGAETNFSIPADVAERIEALAATHGATAFMVVHAALATLLSRLSATDDIAVSTPVAGRGQAVLDRQIGMFVNTLVLRTPVDQAARFADLLDAVKAVDLDAFANLDVPFEAVVDAVDPIRSEAFAPLAQVMLSFDPAASLGGVDTVDVAGLRLEQIPATDVPSQVDLTVVVSTDPTGDWSGSVTYATDLFDQSTVDDLTAKLVQLLSALTAAPATVVGDAPLLTEHESALVSGFERGDDLTVSADTLASMVAASVAAHSDRTALVFQGRSVSFAEFGARVATLGRELIAAGIGPDAAVGVCMERSVEMMVAIHAITAAGGHYVPIDPSAPRERAEYMVATAGVSLVLVRAGVEAPDALGGLAAGVRLLGVDASGEIDLSTAAIADAERAGALRASNAAYTLFTSGSTGRPKGVTVSHEAIVNRLAWMDAAYPMTSEDRVVQKTPTTFDVSVWELYWPLIAGVPLVIAEPDRHGDPQYLAELIAAEQVSVLHFVPSMLATFTDVLGARTAELTSVRTVFTSGEALTPTVADSLLTRLPDVALHNLYGPTEAAVDVTAHRVALGELVVPIGAPVANTSTVVLDARLRRVPVGVPGELYLGGVQLARGYASRADLTAERFVADPVGNGSLLYRTGDLVRWNAAGELEYLGRTDFQVKLRGQRLELGEVESAISAAPGVVHAAASVVAIGGGDQLVGWFSPSSVNVDGLRAAVAEALPEYMRPSVWVPVDTMVLTSSGKVDRKALPAPVVTHAEFVAPATDAEQRIAEVFVGLVGADRVSATESFFDLGGNSLSAMRAVARVSDALGVEVSIRDLFDAPTVRELAAAVAGRAPALPPVTYAEARPALVPLSFAQQRMWFINQMEPELATYNIPALFQLAGEIDVDALRAATVDVMSRHEVLRTTFPDVEGTPYQSVTDIDAVPDALDWRVVESADQLEADLRRGFDVSRDLPLRARLVHTGDGQATFGLVAHHIAFDGQSFGPLAADLLIAYSARVAGSVPDVAPLDVQFADYAIWQREVLGAPDDPSSVLGEQLDFWTRNLAGMPDVLDLPTDRPRPLVATHDGALHDFVLPAELGRRIDTVAAQHGATRFMVLHAAFAALLARLTGTTDIAVGTPVGGRGQQALDAMVGMFVNTLVLRTEIEPATSFADLLKHVRDADLDAFAHADVPFESVVDAVNPVRSEAFSPLAQVILSVDPIAAATTSTTVAGMTVTPIDITEAPAQVDLNLTISTGADDTDWSAIFTYATDLFDHSTVEQYSARFVQVLTELLSDVDQPVGDAPMVDTAETTRLLNNSAGTVVAEAGQTIADLVAGRIADSADRPALVTEDRTFSYAEFGQRVALLARQLIAVGVGPNVAVGVAMRRTPGTVIAIHAIMAAGGQYVPIDPETPLDRSEYMITTAGVGPVVVEAGRPVPSAVATLGARSPIIEIDVDAEIPAGTQPLDAGDRSTPLRLDDAAYTLFTSGSTGRPKGVTISHRAVANFVAWFDEFVPDGEQRLLFKTIHTFDASVLELFWPLTAGQTMVVAEAEGHRDPQYLARLMAATGVTVAQFVPSLLSVFLEVVDDADLMPGLQVLFSGGEALSPAVHHRFVERVPNVKVVNLFGPTEAAVYTMSTVLDDVDGVVPIGTPMQNTTSLILDSRLHPVPDGVAGELYLGGVQSARGYAARPDLTAERFVADPFGHTGARMYRTGDLVRRNATGQLEYLGRTDFQVKLRGQRMELGEVETAIADAPGVTHAAARVVAGPAGDQLVGYAAPATVDLTTVQESIAAELAEYMRPTVWVLLDEMPLNAAGKVDRRALPDPEFEAAEYVAPESDAEAAVAEVFAGLVGADRVSVTESFFDLGGNSLAAMRLAARASDALGVQVSVRDIFDGPSVRELVAAVQGRAAALPPVTAVVPRPDRIPLSFAQQRMWFINRLEPESPAYNIPLVMSLRGALDIDALRAAVVDVVSRHEVLRSTYPSTDGEPYQSIHSVDAIDERLDWQRVDSHEAIADAIGSGFAVDTDWPIRVRLWSRGPADHVLAVVLHHIAADGESFAPLVSDLVQAYAARADNRAPEFAPLDVQFADYALWQHDVLGSPDDPTSVVGSQLSRWTQTLEGLPDVLELPADRPRPQVASGNGVRSEFVVPDAVAERVRTVAEQHGVTPFMVLHAGLSVTLARLTGTSDIAVGTPVAGRGREALDSLIGMFVNTLVLRLQVDSGATFEELLSQAKSVDVEAFANADVPFEILVDALNPVRSQSFTPLTQVMLVAARDAASVASPVEISGIEFAPMPPEEFPAQRDLTVTVELGDGSWNAAVVAAADLFDNSSVEAFADRFVRVLESLCADPLLPVGDVDVLSAGERAVLAGLPVAVTETVNAGRSLTDLFADESSRV